MRKLLVLATLLCPVSAHALSPADVWIAAVKSRLAKDGSSVKGLDELAQAWLRKARESGDSKYLTEAESALKTCFAMDRDDFGCGKSQTQVLLQRDRPEESLALARKLNRRIPDDVPTYGLVADAAMALGKTGEAEKATQWMFDMRPPGPTAFERAAELRRGWGDFAGAAEFLQNAIQKTPAEDIEQKAWLFTRLAGVQQAAGDPKSSSQCIARALELIPDYAPALAESRGNERSNFNSGFSMNGR